MTPDKMSFGEELERLYAFLPVARGTLEAMMGDQSDPIPGILAEQDHALRDRLVLRLTNAWSNFNAGQHEGVYEKAHTLKVYRGWISQLREIGYVFPEVSKISIVEKEIASKAEQLRQDIKTSSALKRRHTIDLAFKQASTMLDVHHITDTFSKLKRVLDGMYAELSGQQRKEVPLYLTSTFDGSYGLQFTTDHDDAIVGNSFDEVIDAVFSGVGAAIDGQNDKTVRDYFSEKVSSPRIIKRYADLFDRIAKSQTDIELTWTSPYRKNSSKTITHRRAAHVERLLTGINLTKESDISLVGRLRCIDLDTGKVTLISETAGRIVATFSKRMEDDLRGMLDKQCEAIFTHRIEYNDEKESFKDTHILREIEKSGTIIIKE